MKHKIVSLTKFIKNKSIPNLNKISVITNGKKTPLGFVFGRDAFISFLEYIDTEFEKKVTDPKKYFDNPAGKLIDAIEEKLPLNPEFVNKLRLTIASSKKSKNISIDDILKNIHV